MSVGDRLLALARQHMGLAASAYITSELRAMGRSRSQMDAQLLRLIAGRARTTALRFMDERDADAFARDVEALADQAGTSADEGETVDHRLALDAAELLLARGDSRRSYLAYKQLAERHADAASFRGLARAAIASGDTARRGTSGRSARRRRAGAARA